MVSTHHPQSEGASPPPYEFIISIDHGKIFRFSADNLDLGPLGSLVHTMRVNLDIKKDLLLRTRVAAAEALSALAPIILQQTFTDQVDRDELSRSFDFRLWSDVPALNEGGTEFIIVRQMLLLLRYLGLRFSQSANYAVFCTTILRLIRDYLVAENDYPTFGGASTSLAYHGSDLVPMIESVGHPSKLQPINWRIATRLIDISRSELISGANLCHIHLTPNCFPALIRMVWHIKSEKVILPVLNSIIDRMRSDDEFGQPIDSHRNTIPRIEYLRCFTRSDRGFSAIAYALKKKKHLHEVATFMAQITEIAANRPDDEPIELHALAVPCFLDAVSAVARYLLSIPACVVGILNFSQDAAEILSVAAKDAQSLKLIAAHSACDKLVKALKVLDEDDAVRERLDLLADLKAQLEAGSQSKSIYSFQESWLMLLLTLSGFRGRHSSKEGWCHI